MSTPETISVPVPSMPAWVQRRAECRYAWRQSLSWRMSAIAANEGDAYRVALVKDAERMYDNATR